MSTEEITKEQRNIPPEFVTGLINLEVMLERIKRNTDKPLEFDALKLSDEERKLQLGGRIRILRKTLGLTQTELAAQLGITPQAVTAFERGKAEPSLKTLIGLSRALKVSTDYLLNAAPPT